MTLNRIQGKFYPLKSEEWLETIKQLTYSELKILYYVRSLDPYNKGISLTPTQIAKNLSTEKSKMHRSTVGRALKSLENKGFIQMELLQVRIKVNPKGFLSKAETEDVVVTQPSCDKTTKVVTPQQNVPQHNIECSQTTESAPIQQSKAETISERKFQTPKISKTYIDFKKTLSESEGENFFKFVKEAIQNFSQPVNDLEAWLASKTKAGQNRWEVYYHKYQEEKKARKLDSNSSSIPDEDKQKAIAKFQEQLKQQRSGWGKIENRQDKEKFDRFLNNPEHKLKRINQLESQSKPISKSLGKQIAEGYEQLRNLRMKSHFANQAVQGGVA